MGFVDKVSEIARRIFPQKYLNQIGEKLEATRLALTAEEFSGIMLLISLGVGVGVFLVGTFVLTFPLPAPVLGGVAFAGTLLALLLALPYYLVQRRVDELEEELPDSLRQMSSTLRAGVGLNAAMEDIAKSGYGELSEEFARTTEEVRRGRPLQDALKAMARRSHSDLFERAFRLIVEGIEHGAALADVLESVADDAREVQAVQRERQAAVTQQVLFLAVASVFAAPFIAGLVIEVSSAFGSIGAAGAGGAGGGGMMAGSKALPSGMETIVLLYVMVQAAISSLALGVIRYGKMMKGLMYTGPFLIGAAVVFYGAKFAASIMI